MISTWSSGTCGRSRLLTPIVWQEEGKQEEMLLFCLTSGWYNDCTIVLTLNKVTAESMKWLICPLNVILFPKFVLKFVQFKFLRILFHLFCLGNSCCENSLILWDARTFLLTSGGSGGHSRHAPPPPSGQFFLDFMQFLGRFNLIYPGVPLSKGWRPPPPWKFWIRHCWQYSGDIHLHFCYTNVAGHWIETLGHLKG